MSTIALLDMNQIAALYRCSYRRARDEITKLPTFPDRVPGSTLKKPLWLEVEVLGFMRKKSNKSRTNYEREGSTIGV